MATAAKKKTKAHAKKAPKKKVANDPMKNIMAQLEKYDEGTEPRTLHDLGCSCLADHKHEHKEK